MLNVRSERIVPMFCQRAVNGASVKARLVDIVAFPIASVWRDIFLKPTPRKMLDAFEDCLTLLQRHGRFA